MNVEYVEEQVFQRANVIAMVMYWIVSMYVVGMLKKMNVEHVMQIVHHVLAAWMILHAIMM